MRISPLFALISILFGILVIVFPDILGWIVGTFFIILGIWFLVDYLGGRGPI
ncbi:MAG: DUF3096 domain-containing protein [Methanomassiliicoccales archaeon]